jgi:hypothetical protein
VVAGGIEPLCPKATVLQTAEATSPLFNHLTVVANLFLSYTPLFILRNPKTTEAAFFYLAASTYLGIV